MQDLTNTDSHQYVDVLGFSILVLPKVDEK